MGADQIGKRTYDATMVQISFVHGAAVDDRGGRVDWVESTRAI